MTDNLSKPELVAELKDLRARLAEAEEVLRAIRNGEVDAVLGTGGRDKQVYTLRGADRVSAEQLARLILEQAAEAIVVCDEQGRVIRASQTAQWFCEVSPLLRPFAEVFPLRTGTSDLFHLAPVLQGETLHNVDVVLDRQGQKFDLILNSGPLLSGQQIIGCVVNLTDITERKRSEKNLQQSYDTQTALNSLLRLSLENIPIEGLLKQALDLILSISWLVLEKKGGIFLVEDEPDVLVIKVQSGLSEQIQKVCARIPFGRCLCGRAAVIQKVQFADCIDERHETTYKGIKPHGHYCVPILFGGKTLGAINVYLKEGHHRNQREEEFLVAIADVLAGIVERKQAEEELQMRERKLTTLFDVLPVGVSILDAEQKIVYTNPTLETILGVSKEYLLKGEYRNRKYLRSDGTQMPAAEFASARALSEQRAVHNLETGIVTENGNVIWTEVDAIPVLLSDWRVVIITTDITERKRAEVERKNLLEQLIRSEKLAAVGELISGVAHEINNPLTGIVGLSELLLRENKENLDEDTKKDLESIYQSSERIRKIVANLLRFARRSAPAKKSTSINELLDTVLEIRSYELKVRNVEVIKHYQPDLPLVMADPSQLEQVFLNLITNAEYAIHATGKAGTLTVTTSLQEEQLEDKKAIIEIADTGAGIPENVFSKLFDPFFTTKPVGKGTGLGLSVSYGIIKEHDGEIHTRNRAEGGAVFTIELPVLGWG